MALRLSDTTLPATPARPKALASWDTQRQMQYRQSGAVPSVHILLDGSGSMDGLQTQLLTCVNQVGTLLQRLLPPLATVEYWVFTNTSKRLLESPVGNLRPLTTEEYEPQGGTCMKSAIQHLLDSTNTLGQHVLIVFTDGQDGDTVLAPTVRELVQQKTETGWLCVYLGAYREALPEGLACGFSEGNCLIFERYALTSAFQQLERGLQKFFTTTGVNQKLLTQHGIFREEPRHE